MIPADIPDVCRPPAPGQTPTGPRIFITGCARSGTTLLLNLMRTLNDVVVLDREHCATELLEHPSPSMVIAKRTPRCADHLHRDLNALRPIWIIDLLRDPRDVITSRLHPYPGYYCGADRWLRDTRATAALRGHHRRLLHLRYETLIDQLDDVQADLAAILGLTIRVPFSTWPAGLPDDLSEQARDALGGLRAPTRDGIGRWNRTPENRARVAAQLRAHPRLERQIRDAGYPSTALLASSAVHP